MQPIRGRSTINIAKRSLAVAAAIAIPFMICAAPASATDIGVLDGHCVADVHHLLGIDANVLCVGQTPPVVVQVPEVPVVVQTPVVDVNPTGAPTVPVLPPIVINVPPIACIAVNAHCPVHTHKPKPPVAKPPVPAVPAPTAPVVSTPVPTKLPATGVSDLTAALILLGIAAVGIGVTTLTIANRKSV